MTRLVFGALYLGVWAIRRTIPLFVMRPFVERRIARQIEDPTAFGYSVDEMRHLMGDVATDADVEATAREHLEHVAWWEELRWHPRTITRQRIEGLENLTAAHASGRGVILCFSHHGHFSGMLRSVSRHGHHVVTMMAPSTVSGPGPNTRQYRRIVRAAGSMINAEQGLSAMIPEIRDGRVVASAVDVPGRTVASFAGRRVRCSAGVVLASQRTGAPIVVATSHRVDGQLVVRLSEPIDATDFHDVDSAVQHLVSLLEPAVLAWPAGAWWPLRCWEPVDQDASTTA